MTQTSGTVDLPYLVDIPTLAEHLGVPEGHVRRLVHERRIPFIKWGRLVRFDVDDVDRWIAASTVPAGG